MQIMLTFLSNSNCLMNKTLTHQVLIVYFEKTTSKSVREVIQYQVQVVKQNNKIIKYQKKCTKQKGY